MCNSSLPRKKKFKSVFLRIQVNMERIKFAFHAVNSSLQEKIQVCVSVNSSLHEKNQVGVFENSSLRRKNQVCVLKESSLHRKNQVSLC